MINENMPYIVLGTDFSIISADDYIKENFKGFLLPGFFKTLLAGFSPEDFEKPTLLDLPAFHMPGVRLLFIKNGDTIHCYPVKNETDILRNGYRNMQYRMREPLTGIFATLPIISDSINNDKFEKALSNIDGVYRLSYKLLRSITNISMASRLLSGVIPEKTVVDFSSLLEDLATGIRTVQRDVTVNCDIEKGVYISANKNLISTAVLNLVANSIKYKQDKDVIIKLSLKKSKSGGVFTYSDNSKGIKDEYLPFVCKPYFSKDPYADGEADPALGLGLFICRTAFEQAGGNMLISSQFGAGVTYTVSLPGGNDSLGSLSSYSAEFLLDRYSELFIQLCESCDLPSIS